MYKRLCLTLYEGKRLLFIFVFSLFCFLEIPKKKQHYEQLFVYVFFFQQQNFLLTTKLFCLRLFSFSDAV